jgi:lysozyme
MESNRRVSNQLERLEKSIEGLKKDVRRVETATIPIKLGTFFTFLLVCYTGVLVSEGWFWTRKTYQELADRLPLLEGPNDRDKRQQESLDLSPLKEGDKVAGLSVTSIYLDPERENHRGVDLAGPVGTPYFAPGRVTVRCRPPSTTSGGGHVASFSYMGMLWELLHLKANTCVAGIVEAGQKVGELGNTGRSTGPHLHLQLREDGNWVEPKRGHVALVLIPNRIDSEKAIALIKDQERFRSCAYHDYAQYSNGWGTKAKHPKECIDPAEADRRLDGHLKGVHQTLDEKVRVPLSPNQRVALTSLVYNIGSVAFSNSQLLRRLNAGDYAGAANQFDVWVHADGERLPGLEKRRQREKQVFLE